MLSSVVFYYLSAGQVLLMRMALGIVRAQKKDVKDRA